MINQKIIKRRRSEACFVLLRQSRGWIVSLIKSLIYYLRRKRNIFHRLLNFVREHLRILWEKKLIKEPQKWFISFIFICIFSNFFLREKFFKWSMKRAEIREIVFKRILSHKIKTFAGSWMEIWNFALKKNKIFK